MTGDTSVTERGPWTRQFAAAFALCLLSPGCAGDEEDSPADDAVAAADDDDVADGDDDAADDDDDNDDDDAGDDDDDAVPAACDGIVGEGFAEGQIAQDFTLEDRGGNPVSLWDFCGKVIVFEDGAEW